MSTEFLKNLSEQVKREQTRTGQHSSAANSTAAIRRGTVAAVNSSGGYYTYDVEIAAANGESAGTIRGCYLWGSGTLTTGDRVFILYEGSRPIPFILSGAGGSSGSASGGCCDVLGFNYD